MKDIVILGSNGFAKEILWLLESINYQQKRWNILGFINTKREDESILGYSIIGIDEWLLQYSHPINAVCGFGSPSLRRKVVDKYKNSHVIFPTIIANCANVSKYASLGRGCIICSHSLIAPHVVLNDFVTLNLSSTIGHDSTLGHFVTVNPGANISGNVQIGSGCEIGTAACIIQGKQLGPNTIVGAGSVIIRDIPGYCTVVGNPGRILER